MSQRNMHVLEDIEDCSTNCVMLSPQDYLNRSAGVRSESRNNNFSPARVAISVAVGGCTQYSIGVSLFELENKVCNVLFMRLIYFLSLSIVKYIRCHSSSGAC